jgi:hypothetical protein
MRLRRTTLAAAAVASIGFLGACTSNPSPKAVAKDIVVSLTVPGGDPLPQAQQDCMLEVIDGMSSDELERLGEANEDEAITDVDSGTPELQAFMADLADCQPTG